MGDKFNTKYSAYGSLLLRLGIGALFIYTGIIKISDPSAPMNLLTRLGFPAPIELAWILLLAELVFGVCVLIGYEVRYTAWPLAIVLLVALFTVAIPGGDAVNIFFHIITIFALVGLSLTGPGAFAVTEE